MDILNAYLPLDRRLALANGHSIPAEAEGSALFADFSGFTQLTKKLAQELGPSRGAEEMTYHLNTVYGLLLAEIQRYGGSGIGFSGDGVLCWFEGDNGRRSAAAAINIQIKMGHLPTITTPNGTVVPFGVKIAITVGQGYRYLVGNPDHQQMEVMAGATIAATATIEQQLVAGQIGVVPAVIDALGPQNCRFSPLQTSDSGLSFHFLYELHKLIPFPVQPATPALPIDTLAHWILPPVFDQLRRGQEAFLANLRPVVALFLRFSGLDFDHDPSAGQQLNAYFSWVQATIEKLEGFVLQLTIGDKGSYLYATFGALIAHEDDAERAVSAAWLLIHPPPEFATIKTQIGVSQGQIYCGAYGAPTRKTYGALGPEVNIAARLMSKAQPQQILVSLRIAQQIQHFHLLHLAPISLKGLSQPLPVAAILRPTRTAAQTSPDSYRQQHPLVGRRQEYNTLVARLKAVSQGQNGMILIEGEAGIGKSRLINEIYRLSQQYDLTLLTGWADAVDTNTSYYVWGPIFAAIFDIDLNDSAATNRWQIQNKLNVYPDLLEQMPLLNAVLPLEMPDNDTTREWRGDGRAYRTQALLSNILAHEASQRPLVLIIEDAHWLDTASWQLLRRIQYDVTPLLLIVVTRPLSEPWPLAYQEFRTSPNLSFMSLQALKPGEALELVKNRLGVDALPADVAVFIHEYALGHPFYSEELALALRDTGLILVENGRCQLAPNVTNLAQLDFPQTIQGVIGSRLDRLPANQYLILKVASVIGRSFPYRILHAVHPVAADKYTLNVQLEILVQLDIITIESPPPDLSYIFKHKLIQEVTYQAMLSSQRRQLHQTVAAWLEENYRSELAAHYPLLAYHWQEAGAIKRAVDYLYKAGQESLRQGVYHEAIRFFEEMLSLSQSAQHPYSPFIRAQWYYHLADAHYRTGRFDRSQQELKIALDLLGTPLPVGWQLWFAAGITLLRQLTHRLRRSPLPTLPLERQKQQRLRAQIYSMLSLIHYIDANPLDTIYLVIKRLNIAEKVGQLALNEQARGYSAMTILTTLAQQERYFEYYRQLMMATLQQTNDIETHQFCMMSLAQAYNNLGDLSQARETLLEARDLAKQAGHVRRWEESMVNIGIIDTYLCNWDEGWDICDDVYHTAVRSGDHQGQLWALNGFAWLALRQGDLPEALQYIQQCDHLLQKHTDSINQIVYLSHRILYYLELDDLPSATPYAHTLRPYLETMALILPAQHGYDTYAAYCLRCWEQAQTTKNEKQAKNGLKLLSKFSKQFRSARPVLHYYTGWYQYLSTGKISAVENSWLTSLEQLSIYPLRYERARLFYLWGRLLPDRHHYLHQAQIIFKQLKAARDLDRVNQLLAKLPKYDQ
ncbi:MAG TPA: AAA family ATPase [Anaerolineae bacterium]|nr:AAA family ATPase [Anaerolineae bacterium]